MKAFYVIAVIQIVIALILCVGWVKCVIKLADCDFSDETSYKAEVIYGVGVFTGIGGVVGYLDLGK